MYESTGIFSNQIETLAHIDMFDIDPGPANSLPALSDPSGTGRVDLRARAYLHANCSICHRSGGTGLGPADFRYQVLGSDLGVLDVAPTEGDFGIPDAALLFPGHPEKSIISLRMHSLRLERMPPLATSVIDALGTQLIATWIESGLGFGLPDSDGDEIADNLDNCVLMMNGPALPDAGGNIQLDTNSDGFGNLCDGDLNNDGSTNALDLNLYKLAHRTSAGDANYNADADFNGDGVINTLDLNIYKGLHRKSPGPSCCGLF